ncbi:MAG: lipoprotein-releasing system permease protein [Bacteroidetes bacterium HLUCCA01]|nr:MAG: lipoprotein-releasing system permease protein [Bacteroidetes bacterium HLUCCA01]
MNPVQLIASRYLFSRKHVSLISVLTTISIAGITVGTALLIIVLSVFNGFFDLIKGLLLSYDPDIRVEAASQRLFTPGDSTSELLADIPEIRLYSPFMEGKALLAHRGRTDKVVEVRGVQPETYFQLIDMDQALLEGEHNLSVQQGRPGIIVGNQLTGQLGIGPGDRLSLLTAEGIQRSLTQFAGPRFYTFDVRGSFYLREVFEGSVVFIDLEAAQRMYNLRGQISGYDIRLHNIDDADAVRDRLQTALGDDFRVSTWYDLQKPLYDVMNIEKWSAYFILMLIVGVAVLNIVGSLTMIVIQKSRDIGVLMSFGYTPVQIQRIFLRQGMLVGLIGCGIGGLAGLAVSWAQQTWGLVQLAGAESFIISAYPVSINAVDVTLVVAGSLVLCLLASWYPARRAASLIPSQVLRYE